MRMAGHPSGDVMEVQRQDQPQPIAGITRVQPKFLEDRLEFLFEHNLVSYHPNSS